MGAAAFLIAEFLNISYGQVALAAAIPALIGYNYLGGQFKRLRNLMEDFALEFMNLSERNFT